MSVTALIGGQWGSEGKGVVAAALAPGFDAAVRVGGPNAGHSFKHTYGESPMCTAALHKHVMRGVPCQWVREDSTLIVGAGAVVDYDLLVQETSELGLRVVLDRNAVLVPQWAHAEERQGLVQRIGSTGEGVGVARRLRIERDPAKVEFARDVEWPDQIKVVDTVGLLHDLLVDDEHEVLLEGTQGSGLSLIHGPWPYATSADTNVAAMLSDAGIAPSFLAHTLMVCRTFPIRVAGNSGPMGEELDWADIPGAPIPEKTTVTRKQRRIARWSWEVVERAVMLNDPCGIVLTFADYLEPGLAGETDPGIVLASRPVLDLVRSIEQRTGVPVITVGTGGEAWALSHIERCRHGDEMFA